MTLPPDGGHEIETELQACGYPVFCGQYLTLEPNLACAYWPFIS
jgi:hypothetical protein